jgi:SAM-dependent methyltransferase
MKTENMNKNNNQTVKSLKIDPYKIYNNLGTDYAKSRPSYPSAAIDLILQGLNPQSASAADIGAGTGIGSCLLADRGVRVYAIEPNADMRKSGVSHSLVEFCEGTSERTNLADASVDLVTSFQAYHWFNQRRTLAEFLRILKPVGRLALIWNQWDVSDEFTKAFNSTVNQSAFSSPLKRLIESVKSSIAPSSYLKPWESWKLFFFLNLFKFKQIRRVEFSITQDLDLSELVGLAVSLAYVPASETVRQQLACDLTELYERYCDENGKVKLVYGTNVYVADVNRNL